MVKAMVGSKNGMYELQSKEAMPVVAFSVQGGIVYQGQGDTISEALCDLALRLNTDCGMELDVEDPRFEVIRD